MRQPTRFSPFEPPQVDWRTLLNGVAGGVAGQGGARLQAVDTFGPNPGALKMFIHVPAALPANAPLVVILHGCGQNAAVYDNGAGWSTLADQFGFAVLAPEQGRANNPNACFSWFEPDDTTRGSGEVASIRQMVRHLVAERRLDAGRVFVTGLSAGGAMASALLATYPEAFAGGAIIAGLPFGAAAGVQQALAAMRRTPDRSRRAWGDLVRAASPHSGPWPRVSVWHGDADATVDESNAAALLAQWGDVHGLSLAPALQERVDGQARELWRDAAGRPALEYYRIGGLGHGTPIQAGDAPGQCGTPGAFMLEAGISSSHRIAEFWGLTASPSHAAAPRSATIGKPGAARASTVADAANGFQPQKIVSAALKAAGLLKDS